MSEESVYNNSFIVYRFFTDIQNNRNENNKKNDTTKKIGKIHIQENEYIKIDRDKSTFKSHRDFSSEKEITFKHF